MRPGDEVVVLPSGFSTTIESIDSFDGPVAEAYPPMAVTVRLKDDLDVSRGDMICRPANQPHASQDVDAMVCWMTDQSALRPDAKYVIKQTTRVARALVRDLRYRIDVNTLHRDQDATELTLNEIGRVQLKSVSGDYLCRKGKNLSEFN